MATATAKVTDSDSTDWEDWGREYRGKIAVSILVPVAWLCFTLLYVGFWASGFSLFQSVIVILVSIILLAGVMGSVWVVWAPYRKLQPG